MSMESVEFAAWLVIESKNSTNHERAEARIKLADIDAIRRHNEEARRRHLLRGSVKDA